MFLLKKLNILLLAIGLSASPVIFATPASDASINKLVQLSEIDILFQQGLKELKPFFDQQATEIVINLTQNTTLDTKQANVAKQLSQAMYSVTENTFKDPQIIERLKKTLKDTYTEQEAVAYNAFLSTPEGQSINRKSTTVTLEVQKFMEEILIKATQSKEFDKEVEKIIAPLMEQ